MERPFLGRLEPMSLLSLIDLRLLFDSGNGFQPTNIKGTFYFHFLVPWTDSLTYPKAVSDNAEAADYTRLTSRETPNAPLPRKG